MSDCDLSSDFNGLYMGARIASIFVLLAVSGFGSFFPLLAAKWTFLKLPTNALFLTKHFGTGVILATAFIHLLGEAAENLSNPCLTGVWEVYPWATGISLMGTFTMFSIELFVLQLLSRRNRVKLEYNEAFEINPGLLHSENQNFSESRELLGAKPGVTELDIGILSEAQAETRSTELSEILYEEESPYKTILALGLLEFGIVFHSVFVGLSLAIAGEEFKTLFVAITFHQFFEGLGLGSRFATTVWPKNMRTVPWFFALAYTLITPIGIAAGLGVRHLYLNNSRGSLIVVGVVDAFCSGILIYNCLVELMAQDFLIDRTMQVCSVRRVFTAYVMLAVGGALMALIGRWA